MNEQNQFGHGQPPHQSQPPQTTARYVAQSPQEILQPKEVPILKKRSKQSKHGFVIFMNFCLSCLMFGLLILGAVFYFGRTQFEQPGPLTAAKTVSIAEGSSLASISTKLEAAGVISSGLVFRTAVRAMDEAGSMKAGEYAFKPQMSMRDVMNTILSGKGIVYKITVPEGLTSFQILQRIANDKTLEGEVPSIIPAEGSLMPDTYPFQRGTTKAQIIELMRKTQAKVLADIWARRIDGLPVNSPEELVTLASIVEKETGKADERPRVASVFINRLNRGMRLQSDPTIIYGIFGGQGKPKDRPIYKSDIRKPTAYNTYTINGLPPTPIANPGKAAMEAVANPSRTNDLYFVASGDGGHVFAKTLKEHNANVRRWRAIESRLKKENSGN